MKRFVALACSAFMFTFLLSAIGPVSSASANPLCQSVKSWGTIYDSNSNSIYGFAHAGGYGGGSCSGAYLTKVEVCVQISYDHIYWENIGQLGVSGCDDRWKVCACYLLVNTPTTYGLPSGHYRLRVRVRQWDLLGQYITGGTWYLGDFHLPL